MSCFHLCVTSLNKNSSDNFKRESGYFDLLQIISYSIIYVLSHLVTFVYICGSS